MKTCFLISALVALVLLFCPEFFMGSDPVPQATVRFLNGLLTIDFVSSYIAYLWTEVDDYEFETCVPLPRRYYKHYPTF